MLNFNHCDDGDFGDFFLYDRRNVIRLCKAQHEGKKIIKRSIYYDDKLRLYLDFFFGDILHITAVNQSKIHLFFSFFYPENIIL